MYVEAQSLEYLHFCYDERVFQVVESRAKIRHWRVFEGGGGLGGRRMRERVCGALEEKVVYIDEVPHSQGAFFEFGGEIQRAHSDILYMDVSMWQN